MRNNVKRKITVVKNILERLKSAYKLPTDAALATFLGVKPNTISMWKKKGLLDYDLILTKCDDISYDWLLTGEGQMYQKPMGSASPLERGRGVSPDTIDIKDIPLYNIKEWLEEFWAGASEDERAWLKIEFGRAFPEYKDWLLKKERDEAGDPPLSQTNGAA